MFLGHDQHVDLGRAQRPGRRGGPQPSRHPSYRYPQPGGRQFSLGHRPRTLSRPCAQARNDLHAAISRSLRYLLASKHCIRLEPPSAKFDAGGWEYTVAGTYFFRPGGSQSLILARFWARSRHLVALQRKKCIGTRPESPSAPKNGPLSGEDPVRPAREPAMAREGMAGAGRGPGGGRAGAGRGPGRGPGGGRAGAGRGRAGGGAGGGRPAGAGRGRAGAGGRQSGGGYGRRGPVGAVAGGGYGRRGPVGAVAGGGCGRRGPAAGAGGGRRRAGGGWPAGAGGGGRRRGPAAGGRVAGEGRRRGPAARAGGGRGRPAGQRPRSRRSAGRPN